MVGLGAVPAIILACILPFCPESPRQLIYHGKIHEAEGVLQRVYRDATPEMVRADLHNFLKQTGADELMITSQIFDHAARLRSFEIAAEAFANVPLDRIA